MNWIKKIQIDLQRWRFRRGNKADAKAQLMAVKEANRLTKEMKERLWVIRLRPGKYIIRTKRDVKAILRKNGIKGSVDLFAPSDTIVHITNR